MLEVRDAMDKGRLKEVEARKWNSQGSGSKLAKTISESDNLDSEATEENEESSSEDETERD